MRLWKVYAACAALFAAAIGASWAAYPEQREWCVARAPEFSKDGPGFELINVAGSEAWATREWTPEDYRAFSLPLAWSLWFKNEPRVAVANKAWFSRSPGCARDGQFSYMTAFGRTFVLVARPYAVNAGRDDQAWIRGARVEKHHFLRYSAGRSVKILQNLAGERYVAVSKPFTGASSAPKLPAGWSLETHALTEDLDIALSGEVTVLRLSNGVSYQGPLQFEEDPARDASSAHLAPHPLQKGRGARDVKEARS